ncbi:unnamed protein product [Blepharisma stoltei]|uniref:Methyltransferase domain-containing protein n=1 Tax=Blepharisma stoltei TaxID=1481888 RepID=A0AAU9JK22_9CILI|nr:unnamed protein product [Blepharisma stoltei]
MADSERNFDENFERYKHVKRSPLYYYCGEYTTIKQLSRDGNYCENSLSGLKILDLGCGSGQSIAHFFEKGADQVIGLDISQEMVESAKKYLESLKIPNQKFMIEKADCSSLESVSQILSLDIYSNYFDIITAFYFHCFAKDENQLAEIFNLCNRYLKPGGKIGFVTLNPETYTNFLTFKEVAEDHFFAKYQNITVINEIPQVELLFINPESKEELFSVFNNIFSVEQFQRAMQRSRFELIEARTLDINPDFDKSTISAEELSLLTGNLCVNYFFQGRKVSDLQ